MGWRRTSGSLGDRVGREQGSPRNRRRFVWGEADQWAERPREDLGMRRSWVSGMVECWQVRTAFSEEDLVRTLGPGPFGYLDGRASWTLDELKGRLAKVRERGYAMDNEETLENVQCVAVPVLDATGSCRGAVGVRFLKTSFGLQVEDVAAPVMAAARRASERLGYRAKYTGERV